MPEEKTDMGLNLFGPVYSNVLHNTFTMGTNTLNPDQTAFKCL